MGNIKNLTKFLDQKKKSVFGQRFGFISPSSSQQIIGSMNESV